MTMPEENDDRRRLFELLGGPDDGHAVIVNQCAHGWPDLLPVDDTQDTTGRYRYDEYTERYAWISA